MPDYPNMRDLAAMATEDYSRIDSLEAIKPPFPAQGSPNWWALRLRYEELLFTKIRRQRSDSVIPVRVNTAEAEAAKWAALGNEQADKDYQSFVPTAAAVNKRRRDWLDAAAEAVKRVA
jgi:hypothetical protein